MFVLSGNLFVELFSRGVTGVGPRSKSELHEQSESLLFRTVIEVVESEPLFATKCEVVPFLG